MCTAASELADFEGVKTYAELALGGRSPDELSDEEIVSSFFCSTKFALSYSTEISVFS